MKKILLLLAASLLAVIALVISSQNDALIQLNFIVAEQQFVLSQALSIFFIVGVMAASLAWWLFLAKSKLKSYQQQRKISQLQIENERLRIQLKDL